MALPTCTTSVHVPRTRRVASSRILELTTQHRSGPEKQFANLMIISWAVSDSHSRVNPFCLIGMEKEV